MPKFLVTRQFSGYVRGQETREVIADSAEEAESMFYAGTEVSSDIIRDDTNTNGYDVEEVKPPKPLPVLTAEQSRLLNVASDFILRKKP